MERIIVYIIIFLVVGFVIYLRTNLSSKKVLKDFNERYYHADKKLYSKFLKKLGCSPRNMKSYELEDILPYIKEDYSITYEKDSDKISVSLNISDQIIDRRNDTIIAEKNDRDELEELMINLHEQCKHDNTEIKYVSEKLNEPEDMVYPYSYCSIFETYEFNINTVSVTADEEYFTIAGIAKYEYIKEIDASEDEDYCIDEKLISEDRQCRFTLPKVFANGNGKELCSVLKKNGVLR